MDPTEAVARSVDVIRALPDWRVLGFDRVGRKVHAVHFSAIFRFVDDVSLRFHQEGEGCLITARSEARARPLDFGQNIRNLRQLTEVLKTQLR
jgi:uncharacterized protein (DUF1499 family)